MCATVGVVARESSNQCCETADFAKACLAPAHAWTLGFVK